MREAIAVAQDAGVKITRAGQSFVAAFDDALNPAKRLTEQIALFEMVGRPASDILKGMGARSSRPPRRHARTGRPSTLWSRSTPTSPRARRRRASRSRTSGRL
jgi:hypothetical protein